MADRSAIDLCDSTGQPLGLRVTLPTGTLRLLVISNARATDDHTLSEFKFPRYFLSRRNGTYREVDAFYVCQPPCRVERVREEVGR